MLPISLARLSELCHIFTTLSEACPSYVLVRRSPGIALENCPVHHAAQYARARALRGLNMMLLAKQKKEMLRLAA